MKRIVALILVLATAFLLSACGIKADKAEIGNSLQPEQSSTSNVKHTGKKITGPITSTTLFYDGLAVAVTKGKAYFINTDGYIVSEIHPDHVPIHISVDDKIVNGCFIFQDCLHNVSGKVTKPEEIGITQFGNSILESGVFVATVVTGDYNGTVNKMGIMNTDLQWVVEPRTDIYDAMYFLAFNRFFSYDMCFSYDTGIYVDNSSYQTDLFLDFETGELVSADPIDLPSDTWTIDSMGYNDRKDNRMIRLSEYRNIEEKTEFVNGLAAVSFYNDDLDKYYYTLIDESGTFQFEPQEINGEILHYDGEYIVVAKRRNRDAEKSISCYDSQMNMLGKIEMEERSYNFTGMHNGIIVLYDVYNSSYVYLNPDMTPVFEVEYPSEE